MVIFTGNEEGISRNDNFSTGERHFEYISLTNSGRKGVLEIRSILKNITFNELVIGGNNTLVYWYLALTVERNKLSSVCEGSIYESKMTGVKGLIKRFYHNRFRKCYACGELARRLYADNGFKGQIVVTKGVGIFNYHAQPPYKSCTSHCNKLLYVGRLSPEKNLGRLIEVVNANPQWRLTIVGFGPLESDLKSMAKDNIIFLGAVDNDKLAPIYQSHDAFVLPSLSETWGLVVEEALNNGLPIAISERAGCSDDWVRENKFGLSFDPFNIESINNTLLRILSPEVNNEFRKNIAKLNFEEIEQRQVDCYCE